MIKILKWFNLKLLLPTLVITTVSVPTLWMIEHPIKYIFFSFQILLTIVLTSISLNINVVLRIYKKGNTGLSSLFHRNILDYIFMILSTGLFLVNILNMVTQVNALLAFIVLSLLPGYVLLRLTNAFDSISCIEALILSYTLSLALNGILPTVFAPITAQNNRLAFLGLLVLFSALPILKDLVTRHAVPEHKMKVAFSFAQLSTLAIVVGFFSIVIICLYPQMSLVPGHDMVRNFSMARLWGVSPELFSSVYPFFHIYQSAIYSVSTPSLEVYQTFLAFASVSVLLSFYIMAKKYLDEIDNRLPFLATVFWAIFSGFGCIYIFEKKLGQPSVAQMSLLNTAYDATYADIGYGLSTNLWLYGFIAMTASFTIFFTLLYLLRCEDVSKSSLMLLTSVLVTALYFIHSSELVMFALLLIVLAFSGQRNGLRINETLFSTFVGLIGIIIISYLMFNSVTHEFTLYPLISVVGLTCLYDQLKRKGMSSKRRSQIMKIFAYALVIFFIAGFLSWFPLGATFSMKYIGDTFLVPWFFFPVRLGITGFLGLLGMLIVAKRYMENAVAIFPFLFFAAFIAGRVISFVNVNCSRTEYWEWRFLFFCFAATSITSTIFLKHIRLKRLMPQQSLGRICLHSFLIGLLVLSGISSTFLTVEGRMFFIEEKYLLDENELNAISFLSSTFLTHKPSPLLTVTHRSASALEFVPSPWVEKLIQQVIWSPKYSEIPLTFINNLRFPPPYIYLHQRDLDAMSSMELQNGYVASHLLQTTTEVYGNSNIKVYESPDGVPPLQNGKSVLVIPSGELLSENNLLASHILSLGGYNYTTMLDSDPKIFEKDILIFPSDSITVTDVSKLGLDKERKIVILNLDGYGPLSGLFFESHQENGEINATHLVTPDADIPLPLEIELTPLTSREGVQILGWYADSIGKAPIVATQMFGGQIEVFYLNVYPIVRTPFSDGYASQDLFQILVNLLDILDLPKYDKTLTSWVIEDDTPVFVFKEGSLKGNISINVESLIPFEKLNLPEVYTLINNSQVLLKDVASLSVQNIGGKVALSSENVKIGNGRGFYTFINADNPEITVTGDKILISASTSNGTYIDVEGSTTAGLSIKGNFSTYLRNPSIHTIGKGSFVEVYAFHSYLTQLSTMGQDLLIEGEVKFGLPLSDEYNIASDFTWDGTATREPPAFAWDELGSLRESIPYFILAIAIFSVARMATQKNLRIRVRRRKW